MRTKLSRNDILILMPILVLYFLLRIPLLFPMNEYWDYDEGTYLMIAKELSEGTPLYKEIFTVHPPLYYYLLAGWMKVFGDYYVVGRALSLTLGAFSLVIAYLIGKRINDNGITLTLLITLDLLTIHLNTVVLHESLLEFFTLLSLYLYLIGKYREMAFVLGIGSSVKHTFLPFAGGLLFSAIGAIKIRDKKELVKAIFSAYLTYLLIGIVLVMEFPSDISRKIFVVPGIGEIEVVGAKYGLLVFLLILIFYILRFNALEVNITKNFREIAVLLSCFIIGKAIIEGPYLLTTESYIRDVYLLNRGRGILFMGLFSLISDFIGDIRSGFLELLYPYVTLLFIGLILALQKRRTIQSPLWATISWLTVAYILIPMPGVPRFLYPYLLTLILALGSMIEDWRRVAPLILVAILFITTLPRGEMAVAFAEHTNTLREELKNINLTNAYSFNPMTAYFLGIEEPPELIDNFGLLYLAHMDPYEFLKRLESRNITSIILGTWTYRMAEKRVLPGSVYKVILEMIRERYSLVYGHSFPDGEGLEIYGKRTMNKNISIGTYNGHIWVFYNGSPIFSFDITENPPETVLIKRGGIYVAIQGNISGDIEIRREIIEIKNVKNIFLRLQKSFTKIGNTILVNQFNITITQGDIGEWNKGIKVYSKNGKIRMLVTYLTPEK
ncbi:glycosyltransferase family 39 protein [Pyrococcus sp. ST04]|uniref:ArnT family glycosyltransferase n=1 Tax=Pyrococcus sp. ST04 TaxID=1183377 RepID=UPI0002605BB9|nr:glycosyltransferase family 39 protein [Pyrococcus sp. ST04]AFK22292.1 hypothetical protein Py04_0690 [Pyrococcus sp. ST04]